MTEWEKVEGGQCTYIKAAQLNPGEYVEGRYTDSKDGKYGLTYFLETPDGTIGINGTGGLDNRMSKVEVGRKIRIVYDGMKTMESGEYKGTNAHQWTVLVAKEEFAPQAEAQEEAKPEPPKQKPAAIKSAASSPAGVKSSAPSAAPEAAGAKDVF